MAATRISDIETMLVSLFAVAFNIGLENIVNERNPGPRPQGRFASFVVMNSANHDYPSRQTVDDPDAGFTSVVADAAYVTVRITMFGDGGDGDGSLSALQTFAQDMRSGWRPAEINQYKIGLGGFTDPKFIPERINGRIIDRSYTDFSFYVVLSTERPVDWFDQVQQKLSIPEVGLEKTSTLKGESNG